MTDCRDNAMAADCHDIAIVGGGFTALYIAHRVIAATATATARIVILEAGTRLGGRILTEKRLGHVMEFGPMRFEPDLQPNFASLLRELGIDTQQFPPYTAPHLPPDFNALTLEEIGAVVGDVDTPPPFSLLRHGLKQLLGCAWDLDNDDIKDANRDARKAWLKRNCRFQGQYLWDLGLWEALASVLSKNAIDYIMQYGTFYHMISLNPNAADSISFMLDILATSKLHLITIAEGTGAIVDALWERVGGAVSLRMGARVVRVTEATAGVELQCADGSRVHAEHVVFTCQQAGLKSIEGLGACLQGVLDSVMLIKLYKIFVVLKNPPWTADTVPKPNTHAEKLPCREIHYYYSQETGTGMIMIYGDEPSLHYWRSFLKRDSGCLPHRGHNERMKDVLLKYLGAMFPGAGGWFEIVDYSILDWSSIGTGVHMWRPGYVSADVAEQLKSFGKNDRLHVCGETYSTYQGFLEGCIRTANAVIPALTLS